MKNMAKLMVAFALALTAQVGDLYAEDNVLYWMVNDPKIENIYGTVRRLEDFPAPKDGEIKEFMTARVRMDDKTGGKTVSSYLTLMDVDVPGVTDLLVRAPGEDLVGPVRVGPVRSELPSIPEDSVEYIFTMELGYYSSNGEWTMMAWSQSETWASLSEKFKYVSTSDIGTDGAGHLHWQPNLFSAVPEPSSGLLILLGGALVALRRRRREDRAA